MLRKLIIYLLLVPLPLNGLWLVCKDAPVVEKAAAETDGNRDSPECILECARRAAQLSGVICFFSAGDDVSVMVISFGTPILPPVVQLQLPGPTRRLAAELSDLYLTRSIAHANPPPKS